MKSSRFLLVPFLALFLLLAACDKSSSPSESAPVVPQKNQDSLSVMTYNVENLFDTTRDADRDDFTYLPLATKKEIPNFDKLCEKMGAENYIKDCKNIDWSEPVLDKKMRNLSDAILSVNEIGPDILLLEEVENQNVLDILNRKYLNKAHYQTSILIEGEDKRGIDVAVLSRLPLAAPTKLHLIEFTPPENSSIAWARPLTRGILEVPLKLSTGETLYVFAFHFPSQNNPKELRLDAVHMLNKLIRKKGPGALVIAGGDCNITAIEDTEEGYIKDILSQEWTVSHLAGCKDCQGTHAFYETNATQPPRAGKLSWSFFDILLFSPALVSGQSGYKLAPETIRIPKSGKYQSKPNGTPLRFNINSGTGVSDHFPMYGELIRR